jgi:hypothetical protein
MNPINVLRYLESEAWFPIQACKMYKSQGKHPWHGKRYDNYGLCVRKLAIGFYFVKFGESQW